MKPLDGDQGSPGGAPDNTNAGMTFVLTIVLSMLGGYWLDGRFGTLPILMIVGLFFGLGIGGYWLYLKVSKR